MDRILNMNESRRNSIDLELFELEYDQGKKNDIVSENINYVKDSTGELKDELELQYDSFSKDFDFNDNLTIPMYDENPVTIKDYYEENIRKYFTLRSVSNYFLSIFPLIKWLHHYNLIWFTQDLIAGITIGCVLVPQSMSYAQIATLPPQYGLYSSFVGAFIYSLFATSKDVCIGPVAVMSLQTAKVIEHVTKNLSTEEQSIYTGPIIATTLALLCGIITSAIGFLRLGFLVEFISFNAVAGFMTGSAFSIIWGQVPGLMGYNKKVNTRTSTYKVVIDTLKYLPDTKLDAVFGLIPLFILYFSKWLFDSVGPRYLDKISNKRNITEKQLKKIKYLRLFFFYSNAMRNGVIIIVFTAISWSITRGKASKDLPISILGKVPKGLDEVGVFKVPTGLFKKIGPNLPASVIILLLEHIAISKSFGRVNDYKIVPDQELIAIGVTNLIGTFFLAYPATGSFSRSALKAKCNVKTPLSGIFSGACVLLALYCLTGAFYYIPKATLSAVIIHAVSDLIASYKTTWNFWKMNPLDCICFLTTVFITVFSSIENGIYFAICFSCAQLIFKNIFPSGKFLGYIRIAEVVNPKLRDSEYTIAKEGYASTKITYENNEKKMESSDEIKPTKGSGKLQSTVIGDELFNDNLVYHYKWVPLNFKYAKEFNPLITVTPPPPGILVYRMGDSFTYLNCSRHYDIVYDEVKRSTKSGIEKKFIRSADRPWNDPGEWECPKYLRKIKQKLQWNKQKSNTNDYELDGNKEDGNKTSISKNIDIRPYLKIICFDFSQVVQTDATAIQCLVDLRKAINRYSNKQIEYHFVGITSPWVKNSLIQMGFGTTNEDFCDESNILGHTSYHIAKIDNNHPTKPDFSDSNSYFTIKSDESNTYYLQTVTGTNYPFFHIDIPNFAKWKL